MADTDDIPETDIAIVGMAGRFPGAADVDALWERVVRGDDCLTDLDPAQLIADGVPEQVVRSPEYVTRSGVLDDVEGFDAAFFGIGARDAAVMDPQHRHFLECAWSALEASGNVPSRFEGAIGVFGGCGANTYLLNNLLTNPGVMNQLGWFLLRHTGNDKDFFTNNVAYRLNLHGPAVNVQTACSTSLVAVHLAVQSLLAFECDLALAGGATIEVPHRRGYEYQEGEILSPDGYCRAFDARSGGTVLTSGAGAVALRRLRDALEAGDPVLAVIKGTAINNDGARKVGFLAPSVDGHADVVREALTVAGLSARDIQLLEAHGTGTAVGDPIEVAALTEAFRGWTDDRQFCRLVSTKPNIGHLDTAAGVASLIKVVQALRHRTLPPLANHTAPSPLLDLATSPFVLSGEAAPWPGDAPRRAGISSLGVGGTNAHVVVEEAPEPAPTKAGGREHVLVLSARDSGALSAAAAALADRLDAEPDVDLADVAHTLATGRQDMEQRMVVAAADTAHAVALLRSPQRDRTSTASADAETRARLAFMFPGGGSQFPGMGAGLDARFEVFHAVRREGAALVRNAGGPDLLPLFERDGDADALRQAAASLPAVFVTSVALARQWIAFGAQPDALLGHSLGEYVAAHLAGVMSFEDAIFLVVTRSRLMGQASGEGAAMLVVPMSEDELLPVLPPSLSLAVINADDECVVAGVDDEIDRFAAQLDERGLSGRRIHLAAAAHSALLDPILPEFLEAVQRITLHAPTIRYPSNLTGDWITVEQATRPQYWVDHLRNTVRFHECVRTVLEAGPTVLSELGPGQALSSYARRCPTRPLAAIPVLRHPEQDVDDTGFALHAFARQWAAGARVDVGQFTGQGRRRLVLPTYRFQHQRYWIEPGSGPMTIAGVTTQPAAVEATQPDQPATLVRVDDIDSATWVPAWKPAAPVQPVAITGQWLVVADDADPLADRIAAEVGRRGATVRRASATPADLDEQIGDVAAVVVVAPAGSHDAADAFDASAARWLDDASAAVRAAGASAQPVRVVALSRGALSTGGPAARPSDALALGVVLVAPGEYPEVTTRLIDVDDRTDVTAIVDEVASDGDRVVALRAGERLTTDLQQTAVPIDDAAPAFRDGGVYVVTGGLGGVGHVLATHLATAYHANLVLISSSELPAPADRARWLHEHAFDDPTSRRIRQLQALEVLGAKVWVVAADAADPAALRRALDEAHSVAGRLDGVIHAAGNLRDQLIALSAPGDHEHVIGAKARGAVVLADELRARGVELLVLVSSTSTTLAPEGQMSYVAANAVLDALAGRHDGLRVATINFGLWADVGVASASARRMRLGIGQGEPVDHPVLGELVRDADGSVHVIGRLDARHHWVVDEHRSASGQAVLPGTAHLDLMLAAAALAGHDGSSLESVALLQPLVVPDDRPTTVRVTVGTGDRPPISIESDGGRGRGWRLHSEGRLAPPAGEPAPAVPGDVDGGAAFDPLAVPRQNLELGGRWDAVASAERADGHAVARLALAPPYAEEAARWRAHPALVDVATAVGVALSQHPDPQILHVPVGYRAVRTPAGPVPPSLTVRAVRDPASSAELLRVDLLGVDDGGAVVLDVRGLDLLPVPKGAFLEAAEVDVVDGPAHHAPTLVELADELGLRPADGAALVERLVRGPHDRIVGSTIDLDALRSYVHRPVAEPTPAAAGAAGPVASVEAAVRSMFVELLGVDDPRDDDDFFELGGHSLIAIRLMTRIHKTLGVRLQLATVFEAPTIALLAARLRAERPELDAQLAGASAASGAATATTGTTTATASDAATSSGGMTRHLVPIVTNGDKRPLYIVHGAGGNVLFLWSLARAMAGERPIYGFQAHGIEGNDMPDPTVEAMAGRYVAELRAHAPGPYLLGGFSGGGMVAIEMARQLQAAGETVDLVVLFDSPTSGQGMPGPLRRWTNLARHALRHGPRAIKPYLRYQAAGMFHRVVPQRAYRTAQIEQDERDLGYIDTEVHGFVNLYYYFTASAAKYEVGRIDVDALLIKADLVWPVQSEDYGWGEHITGRIEIRTAPGDHDSMFFPENAPALAEALRPALDALDPR